MLTFVYLLVMVSFSTPFQPRFQDPSEVGKKRDPGNEVGLSFPKSAIDRNREISQWRFFFCQDDTDKQYHLKVMLN